MTNRNGKGTNRDFHWQSNYSGIEWMTNWNASSFGVRYYRQEIACSTSIPSPIPSMKSLTPVPPLFWVALRNSSRALSGFICAKLKIWLTEYIKQQKHHKITNSFLIFRIIWLSHGAHEKREAPSKKITGRFVPHTSSANRGHSGPSTGTSVPPVKSWIKTQHSC